MIDILISLVVSYIYVSLVENLSHRFPMHREIKGLEGVYSEHRKHHSIYRKGVFAKAAGKIEERYENLVICLFEHTFALSFPAALLAYSTFPTFSVVLVLFSLAHYLAYNQIHVSMHLGARVKWLPKFYWEALLRNHYLHHCYPDKHFNVALLGADYLLGTAGKLPLYDLHEWRKVRRQSGEISKEDREGLKEANQCFLPALLRRIKGGIR